MYKSQLSTKMTWAFNFNPFHLILSSIILLLLTPRSECFQMFHIGICQQKSSCIATTSIRTSVSTTLVTNASASTIATAGFSPRRKQTSSYSILHKMCPNDDDNNYIDEKELIFEEDEDFFLYINEKKARQQQLDSKCATPAASTTTTTTTNPTDEYIDAGVPRSSLTPEEVAPLLMKALENNDFPRVDAGLISMWEFSGDMTKFIFKNNITEFIESCHETANEFPTSFYGVALNGQSWEIETNINRVGGEDGWIATQIVKTISIDGRMRRWQWELRKNKRPPCLGCWRVETIASSDRKGDFETRGRGTGWED